MSLQLRVFTNIQQSAVIWPYVRNDVEKSCAVAL